MMHCTELEKPKARKTHVCMSCGQQINIGENYVRWRCYIDGDASTNKMHPECHEMHNDEPGQWEYTPYSHERPNDRVKGRLKAVPLERRVRRGTEKEMNNAQMLAELAALPDVELLQAGKITDELGANEFYSARTVVLLLAKEREKDAAFHCGISRAEWHDKAWALYHARTFDDVALGKLSIHTIRAVFDATYDALKTPNEQT